MSLLDKLKSLFSGSSDEADAQEQNGSFLQSPTNPDVIAQPSEEEIAAAAQAEPPTTTVTALGDEPADDE